MRLDDLDIDPTDSEWNRALDAFNSGDFAGALFLFKKMEKEGSLDAIAEIGNIYELGGGGVRQDFVEAKKWYTKAAHLANDVYAYLGLGRLYYFGKGVSQDYGKALFYFSRLKDCEIPGALFALGRMYLLGQGTKQDLLVARIYFERAGGLGHVVAKRDIGIVDIKQGRYFSGLFRFIIGALAILKVALHNPRDRRLLISK